MQYIVAGEQVYINCISIDRSGIRFAYSTEQCTEIFEMIRLADWLYNQMLVRSKDQAIIMLLMEASKVANDIWINVG